MPLPLTIPTSASSKFGRTYQLTVRGKNGQDISINFPTTLELSITHNIFASSNVADFSLYGLSASNRSEIAFNQFLKPQAFPVILRAGYLSQAPGGLLGSPSALPVIFDGYANVAFTEKQGPELITRINALDNGDITTGQPAGFFGPTNSYSAKVGTSFSEMFQNVVKRLSGNVTPGFVQVTPTPPPVTGKPRIFTGNVWDNLQKLAREASGAHVFIENNICNMLGQNDVLSTANNLGILSSSSGLLGIPKYTDANIMCSCIFEPSLRIGALLELQSQYNPQISNVICKIVGYTHHGVISGVESGELYSDIVLMSLKTPMGAINP